MAYVILELGSEFLLGPKQKTEIRLEQSGLFKEGTGGGSGPPVHHFLKNLSTSGPDRPLALFKVTWGGIMYLSTWTEIGVVGV